MTTNDHWRITLVFLLSSLVFSPDLLSVNPRTEDISLAVHNDKIRIRAWTKCAFAVVYVQAPDSESQGESDPTSCSATADTKLTSQDYKLRI